MGAEPGTRIGMGIAGSGPPPTDFEPFGNSKAGGGRLEDGPRSSGGSIHGSSSGLKQLEDAPRSSGGNKRDEEWLKSPPRRSYF